MKKHFFYFLITFLFLATHNNLFAQNGDNMKVPHAYYLGKKTYQDILNLNSGEPCQIVKGESLHYCFDGGFQIGYFFKNNILTGFAFYEAFLTKKEAEADMQKQVSEFSKKYSITPQYEKDYVFFATPSNPIDIIYSLSESDNIYLVMVLSILE